MLPLPIDERDVHTLLLRLAEVVDTTGAAAADVPAALAAAGVRLHPAFLGMVMVGVAHMEGVWQGVALAPIASALPNMPTQAVVQTLQAVRKLRGNEGLGTVARLLLEEVASRLREHSTGAAGPAAHKPPSLSQIYLTMQAAAEIPAEYDAEPLVKLARAYVARP